MNYQKLDAGLALALNDVDNPQEPSLNVFIQTQPDANSTDAPAILENLGVADVVPGKDIFTATLSPNAISQLSEQPWVQSIKLSQKMRLLNRR